MVSRQIVSRGLRNPRLLAVMSSVPRHLFVSSQDVHCAYSDEPLPIGRGQTISQPYIVALMTDLLELEGSERLLEVGTGSGYQAAVLAGMASEIHTVELIPELAEQAGRKLSELGYENVFVHCGDGTLGWPPSAPYGGILVAAAAPCAPQPLLDQLAEGARLVLPVGSQGYQKLEIWRRKGAQFEHQDHLPVAFVPLRGKYGWN